MVIDNSSQSHAFHSHTAFWFPKLLGEQNIPPSKVMDPVRQETFLGTTFPEGIESVFLLKNHHKMQLKGCDHSKRDPTREKIPTGNKKLDYFVEFWCGKGLGWGRSRYRIYGRFNEVGYNVERRRDIYLSPEMKTAKFIQVSSALSVVKRSELTFPR